MQSSLKTQFCSVLGKGATGAVFQGVNKHNGETVAVIVMIIVVVVVVVVVVMGEHCSLNKDYAQQRKCCGEPEPQN